MEVRILGPLEILQSGECLQAGPKERVVLARLAAARGRPVSDDGLVDLLWGDDQPASARKGLNGYIYRLRRLMGDDAIVRTAGGYALHASVVIDVSVVEEAARRARLASSDGHLDDAAAIYREARALFRGDALPELEDDDTARVLRNQARELELCLAEEAVDLDMSMGHLGEAVVQLEHVVAADPTRERAWAQLATALAASGRQADAFDALARAKRALALELGIEPGARLREVEQAVLEQRVAYGGRAGTVGAPIDHPLPCGIDVIPFPPLLLAGRSTGYVGRRGLLERLAEIRHQAFAGSSRAVLLTGEPGMGKTRTAAEVAHAGAAEGALVLYGRCDDEIAVPYQPFVEALDWETSHTAEPILGRHPGELARLQPLLGSRVAGLPPPVSSDPRSEEYLLFEATKSWLVELARNRPLVVVIDDLHWASKPVLVLLAHVLRAAAAEEGVRLLVVGTYRDTEVERNQALAGVIADLRRLTGVEALAVAGLSSAEVEEFVSSAAGHDLDDDGRRLAEQLHADTEGNPFFVGEVLRQWVETGAVRRESGRWVLAEGVVFTVPDGVRDVVHGRLGRLTPEVSTLLSLAAVVGRDFEVELLAALSEAPEGALLDALDEAVKARLIEETGPDRYRFAHALVRTTLFDGLSSTRRRRMHRRAGEAIEKLRPADVVALAHHFAEAGGEGAERSRAVRYGLAAAEQALEARALADAEARFRAVLDVIVDLADAEPGDRIRALCGLGEAQRDQGDPEFRTTLLEAGRLAQSESDAPLLVRAALSNSRGVPSVIGGLDAERVAITASALELIGPEPSPDRARLLAQLAAESTFTTDCDRRLALADEAEEMARRIADPAALGWVLNRTGYATFGARRAGSLVARGREATELSDASGDPAQRVLGRYFWAGALLTTGDMAELRRVTREMLAVAADAAPTLQWLAQATQARLHMLAGEFPAAEAVNNDAFQMAQELGEADGPAWWAAIICPMWWCRGQFTDMADVLRTGAEQYPGEPAWAIACAWCLAIDGRHDDARRALGLWLSRPDRLLDHAFPFFNIQMVALTAFHLDDAGLAARTASALRPYKGCWAHQYAATIGPVDIAIAACAAASGSLDEALLLCEETDRVLVAAGCRGLLPIFWTYYAQILCRRGSDRDRGLAGDILDRVRQEGAALDSPRLVQLADDLGRRFSIAAAATAARPAAVERFP